MCDEKKKKDGRKRPPTVEELRAKARKLGRLSYDELLQLEHVTDDWHPDWIDWVTYLRIIDMAKSTAALQAVEKAEEPKQ